MAEAPTTKQNAPVQDVVSRRAVTLHKGERYRCATCYMKHGTTVVPARMCHHCGRLFCAECAPKLPSLLRPLFQHQELKWMSGRGQRRRVAGERWLEAAHCDECVHYTPRLGPWLLLGAVAALLLLLLLWLFRADSLQTTLAPVALFVVWSVIGIVWRTMDARVRQRLFFPLTGKPYLRLEERFDAEAELNGVYTEKFNDESLQGSLRASIPLRAAMAQELDIFARAHSLNDRQLEALPATGGSVVMENVFRMASQEMRWSDQGARLVDPAPPWPQHGSRRWELAAPLPQWPLLWSGQGEAEKELRFPYKIDWWVPRMPFRFPFPVQVQAHFPERGERRTLTLEFVLTTWMHTLHPFIRQVQLRSTGDLPPFTLLPVQGRPLTPSNEGQVEIEDLNFGPDRTSRLQLRFEQAPPQDEPAWLEGTVLMFVPSALSGARIAGYFNAFGNPEGEIGISHKTMVRLRFRINLASLAYQRLSRHEEQFALSRVSAERDDAILDALSGATHLIRAHERVLAEPLLGNGAGTYAPRREAMGRWPAMQEDDMSPIVYQVELTPEDSGTQVKIQVEAPVADDLLQKSRAEEYGRQLRELIEGVDRDFWGSEGRSRGTGGPPPPRPASGTDLLSRQQRRKTDG